MLAVPAALPTDWPTKIPLHISAGLGTLVGVSSVIGKGVHGSVQLGQLWNFAVGFEHADVQTRATSCGCFLGLLHSRDVVFRGFQVGYQQSQVVS